MGKIVLRTNLANKNFSVEHKVLETPIKEKLVELIISPNAGYSIDAKDFNNGFLPKNINSIQYVNSGSKVIAQVKLTGIQDLRSTLNIALPISGNVKAIEHKLLLIDTCSNDNMGNTITTTTSAYASSDQINECHCNCEVEHPSIAKSYNVTSKLGSKNLVLSKTFIAPKNYYFSGEPTYTITGNSSRYTIKSKVNRNDKNKLIFKYFEIYYTAPKQSYNIENTDSICFSSELNSSLDTNLEEVVAIKDKKAIEQSDYKIYSFSSGRAVGVQGGVKKIEIKGVPGTPFKIISQDSNPAGTGIKTYNWTTGVFEVGGGMLKGVIPSAQQNMSYGNYITYIKVPRNTVNNTVQTRLISDGFVDHDSITGADTQANVTTLSDDSIVANTSITFTIAGSGITLPASSTFTVGPGNYRSTISEPQTFTIKGIYATTDAWLKIVRQPKHDITKVFHSWDSGDATKEIDSDGNEILTDWNVSGDGIAPDNSETKYRINAVVTGRETADLGVTGYKYIDMKITVSGVQFGKSDPTPELVLFNFLTRNAKA